LKDEFGALSVKVGSYAKAMTSFMPGMLALTVD